MISTGARRALLAVCLCALAIPAGAAADEGDRGIDPNQGRSLVEVTLPNKAASVRLELEAESYGVDFNNHYLRKNRNGTVTVTVFADEAGLQALHAAGHELGATIEGPATWAARLAERQADVKAESVADAAATGTSVGTADSGEIVVL